jgi:hypothetical protein
VADRNRVLGFSVNRSLRTAETEPFTPASADLQALYPALVDADDRGDAQALARLGWVLYATASAAQQAHGEAIGLLEELRIAARVVVAGDGSPASFALLRHVLATHGWLPPRGATPLQVLAAPIKAASI